VVQETRLAFGSDEVRVQSNAQQAGGEEVPLAYDRFQVLPMHILKISNEGLQLPPSCTRSASLLLALSGHRVRQFECPLSGGKADME